MSGCVWPTVPADLEAHFLAGGESMLLPHAWPVVIQGDGPRAAAFRVTRRHPVIVHAQDMPVNDRDKVFKALADPSRRELLDRL